MKYALAMAALAAPVVFAAPARRQNGNIDTTVLQFALTLEHLENVFYHEALAKFSQEDFAKAGYGANYYNNLKYIASDELSHVQFLQAALTAAGQTPTAQCTYTFPYTDVNSFIALSSVIEGVGTSAYLGGAPLITSKDYLTAAGSILVTEALHTSLQRNAVNEIPFASPYGTPLDPTSVYTLASAFIKQCPPTNPTLPFTPYPALTLTTKEGSCEQVDCSPQVFQKRDWTSTPAAPAAPADKPKDDKPKDGECKGDQGKDGHGDDYKNGDKDMDHHDDAGSEWKNYGNGADYHNGGKDMGDHSGSGWENYGNGKPAPSAKNMPALMAGQAATFTAASAIPAGSFLTFVSGLMVVSVPASINGNTATANIPPQAMGQTYVFVTKAPAANNKLDGSTVLFGPAILEVKPAPPSY